MLKNIVVPSFTKINLLLEVESLRKDRFHNIFSYIIPLDMSDYLTVKEHSLDAITFDSNDTFLKNHKMEDLTLGKAIKVLTPYKKNNKKFHIYLHKLVPYGSGLGIASSNAVSLMKVLNQIWECNLNIKELEELSLSVGSDCPLFFHDSIMRCQEKGNKIDLIGKKPLKFILMVFFPKGIHIDTKESYDWLKEHKFYSKQLEIREQFEQFFKDFDEKVFKIQNIYNSFETRLLKEYPLYKKLREALEPYSFCYSLTGSGSAYYALFNKDKFVQFFNKKNEFLQNFFDLYTSLL